MRYSKIRSFLLIISTSMLLSFYCKGETMNLSGKLVYSQSNSIHILNLSTLEDDTTYIEQEEFSIFTNLTKVDDKRLFFVDDPHHFIKELNIKTKAVKKIGDGYYPQYISEHKKLFFYDVRPDKNQRGLFMVDIESPLESAQLVREGRFSMQAIQISRDEIIFHQDQKLWLYNIVTGSLQDASIKNCTYPKAFRSVTKQLLCFDTNAQHYFLTDLKVKKVEPVPALKSHTAALYIPKYDTLIFGKTRLQLFPPLGEVIDIWAYSFKSKKETRLKKHAYISLGSAIWIDD